MEMYCKDVNELYMKERICKGGVGCRGVGVILDRLEGVLH
jgi:hypothetical protein